MQSIRSIRIRMIIAVRGCFVLAGLLSTLIFILCADGMAQSDQVVARGQKVFFEAWLERELSGDELRKVTDEFIVFYTKMGKNRAVLGGIALGVPAALAVTRLIASRLFGVSPTDPLTLAVAVLLMFVVAAYLASIFHSPPFEPSTQASGVSRKSLNLRRTRAISFASTRRHF